MLYTLADILLSTISSALLVAWIMYWRSEGLCDNLERCKTLNQILIERMHDIDSKGG